MKPIYIKMQAFGSYLEETISFSDVNQGLFLITGDTGAGKTTIFDAITFALYGKTSGGKRDGKMMRSQYAPEQLPTKVEFCFQYSGKTYTIRRSPEQPKYKLDKQTGSYVKLKTSQAPSVELTLPDGSVYPGKIDDTNQKITEIIGLSVEQFTQVAMLAQGDFMKLLLVPSKERKEIFAKIFDTQIYGKIEQLIHARFAAAESQLNENEKEISRELSNIRCVKESAYAPLWEEEKQSGKFHETADEGLLELLKHICEEATEKQAALETLKKEKQQKLNEINQQLQTAEEVNSLFASLEENQRKLASLKAHLEEIKLLQEKVSLGQKAQEVELFYQQYENQQSEIQKRQQKKASLEQEIQEKTASLADLQNIAESCQKQYEEQYPKLHAEIQAITDSLEKYEELVVTLRAQTKNTAQIQALETETATLQEALAGHETRLAQLEEEIEKRRDIIQNGSLLDLKISRLQDKKADLESLLSHIKSLHSAETALIEKERILKEKQTAAEAARQAYDICYHNFISDQAALLRAELRDGEPCPVCGSIHHSIAADGLHTDSSGITAQPNTDEKAVHAAKEKLDAACLAKEQAETAKRDAASKKEIRLEAVDAACKKLFENHSHFDQNTEPEAILKLEAVSAELKSCQKERKRATENETLLKKALEEKDLRKTLQTQDNNTLKEKTELLHQRQTDAARLESSITALRQQLKFSDKQEALEILAKKTAQADVLKTEQEQSQRNYMAAKTALDRKSGELEQTSRLLGESQISCRQAQTLYEEQLEKQGFADTAAFTAAKLARKTLSEYQETIKHYEIDVQVTQAAVTQLTAQTMGKQKIATELFLQEKTALSGEMKQIDIEEKELFHLVSVNQTSLKNIVALYASRGHLRQNYMLIKNLDDTANGKLSKKHVNFQTYIQRQFFKQVIASANQRLIPMSKGQFRLECQKLSEVGTKGEVGLDLNVYSIVNDQTRDVKTLSGGESFMAALSMALGMADIIQNSNGKVHIDTMFIDEGFGALSDETREEAIAVLGELSQGNRLVGIISHVTELKAQVDTKLVVSKGDKGSHVKWEF